MQEAMRFIQDNFKQVSVLKERNGGLTEIVIDAEKAIFIRKTIPYTGLPYRKLMQLTHPLLPKVYYAVEEDGRTCVIEQYVDGRNLQDVLDREGALAEAEVRRIGLQLCDALEFLHGQGIIHRDIKPSNIIIKEDGSLCLIDFGAARVVREGTEQDTRILGTPGYAPPEQYGFAATDFRSDFYALGMTLKALLGNKYQGGLTSVIRRCVELDPGRRVSSAKELRDLLQPHWYDFLLQCGKRKMAAGLVALLLLGGIALWNTQQPDGQKLPEGVVATQVTSGVESKSSKATNKNNAAVNEKKAAAEKIDSGVETNGTGKREGDPLNQTAASENQTAGNATKAELPIVSSNKNDSAKESSAGKVNAVQFTGSNWNVFQKTEQHLGPKVPDADKVIYPAGKWPQISVQNNSDTPLKNPQAVLYFNDFGVVGSDFSVTDHDNKMFSSKLAGKGENGVARTVTLRYDGMVPPHEMYSLNLFGGIAGLFKTGANPSVRIVFSADNADTQEKSYTIGIR